MTKDPFAPNSSQEVKKEIIELELSGCSPTPLNNYLKPLGLLRILGKIDSQAQGYWSGNRFILKSPYSAQELFDLILKNYRPSAICTPWNGSSGFYGKRPDALAAILNSNHPRFKLIKTTYTEAQKLIKDEGLKKQPTKKDKDSFIKKVKDSGFENWRLWLDVVAVEKVIRNKKGELVLSYSYPAITGGTGGVVGNKDLGAVFIEALSHVYDMPTGEPLPAAQNFLESSLMGTSLENSLIPSTVLTQFSPVNDFYGDISGASAHSEYAEAGGGSTSRCNPWDAILLLEGLLTFSGISGRRQNQEGEQSQAEFSLAVDLAGGTADVSTSTETSKRLEEIWVPLWNKPLNWEDIRVYFTEIRNRLPNQQVTDTIDFALAMSREAKESIITRFVRYAFLPRKGQANFAIPVGQFSPHQGIVDDLASQLRHFRRYCRQLAQGKYSTPRIKSAISLLEKELLKLASGKGTYLQCLMQIGILESEITYSSILQTNDFVFTLPYLKTEWIERIIAEDKSPECRLGIAIASLGLRERATKIRVKNKEIKWEPGETVHWGRCNLVDNLISLQRRWSIEQSQAQALFTKNLVNPKLSDLEDFICGRVDDSKIQQIALGASVCKQISRDFGGQRQVATLPPQYALTAICQWGKAPDGNPVEGAMPIVNTLARKQPQRAMELAIRRLRSRDLAPLLQHSFNVPNSKRIAAAISFPLSSKQLNSFKKYHIQP